MIFIVIVLLASGMVTLFASVVNGPPFLTIGMMQLCTAAILYGLWSIRLELKLLNRPSIIKWSDGGVSYSHGLSMTERYENVKKGIG